MLMELKPRCDVRVNIERFGHFKLDEYYNLFNLAKAYQGEDLKGQSTFTSQHKQARCKWSLVSSVRMDDFSCQKTGKQK